MAGYVARAHTAGTATTVGTVDLHYYKVGYAGGPNDGKRMVEGPPSVHLSRQDVAELLPVLARAVGVPEGTLAALRLRAAMWLAQ